MTRYEVLIQRTEVSDVTVWVDADDENEAQELAEHETYEVEMEWQALETSYDYTTSPVDMNGHEAQPSGGLCAVCAGRVRWSGTDAPASPTSTTIPGPWVHDPIMTTGDIALLKDES